MADYIMKSEREFYKDENGVDCVFWTEHNGGYVHFAPIFKCDFFTFKVPTWACNLTLVEMSSELCQVVFAMPQRSIAGQTIAERSMEIMVKEIETLKARLAVLEKDVSNV
jgi:hypothetical protein